MAPTVDYAALAAETKFTEDQVKQYHEWFQKEHSQFTKEKFLEGFEQQGVDKNIGVHLFHLVDKNKDGKLDFLEFVRLMGLMENGTPQQKMDGVFNVMDLDGDGFLTVEEITEFVQMMEPEPADLAKMAEVVKAVDQDGDGKISRDEFHQAMVKEAFKRHFTCP